MTQRILQIIPSLDNAGAEKQLSLLATHLPRDEFDVHVCVLTRGGPYEAELQAAGVPVTKLDKRHKIDPIAYWRLKRLIAQLKPDLVQTWLFAANAYGRAAALSAGVKAIVASERCVDPWKGWTHQQIDDRLARRTDRIVVNDPGVRDFYVARGIAANKFKLIRNGIAPFEPSGTSRAELLAELNLPADARLIGGVGRLWPQKRVKDLIWAADLLKVIRDDVHLLIVGDGPQRRDLERYRDHIEIRDRVHFLGQRQDVPRLLEHLDLLWLGSGYEGLPNVIMEAMTAGLPVVATDIPGNRQLVVPQETGYLVPVGDRAGLARYANKLLNDRELSQKFGATAKEIMRTEYAVENMVAQHAKLYRELLQT